MAAMKMKKTSRSKSPAPASSPSKKKGMIRPALKAVAGATKKSYKMTKAMTLGAISLAKKATMKTLKTTQYCMRESMNKCSAACLTTVWMCVMLGACVPRMAKEPEMTMVEMMCMIAPAMLMNAMCWMTKCSKNVSSAVKCMTMMMLAATAGTQAYYSMVETTKSLEEMQPLMAGNAACIMMNAYALMLNRRG